MLQVLIGSGMVLPMRSIICKVFDKTLLISFIYWNIWKNNPLWLGYVKCSEFQTLIACRKGLVQTAKTQSDGLCCFLFWLIFCKLARFYLRTAREKLLYIYCTQPHWIRTLRSGNILHWVAFYEPANKSLLLIASSSNIDWGEPLSESSLLGWNKYGCRKSLWPN